MPEITSYKYQLVTKVTAVTEQTLTTWHLVCHCRNHLPFDTFGIFTVQRQIYNKRIICNFKVNLQQAEQLPIITVLELMTKVAAIHNGK